MLSSASLLNPSLPPSLLLCLSPAFSLPPFLPVSLSYIDQVNDIDLTEILVWNLRTWPLELVEWNTTNSHRLDITFNPEQDRYIHTQKIKHSLYNYYSLTSYFVKRSFKFFLQKFS